MAGKTLEMQLADLEAKTDKTPDQIKAVGILKGKIAKKNKPKAQKPAIEAKPIIEPEVKVEPKPQAEVKPVVDTPETKVKFKEADNDFQDYQKFGELKFIQWKEDKFERKCLKPKTLIQFEKLEAKFKDYPGKIPKINKTVSIDMENKRLRIVKGFGVPGSLYQMFVKADAIEIDKYFE